MTPLKIALKNNLFHDDEVFADIGPFNRDRLAKTLESSAVKLPFDDTLTAQSMLYGKVYGYLKDHPYDVAAVDLPSTKGLRPVYFMYTPMVKRWEDIPAMRIEEVDTQKPWLIAADGSCEKVAYIQRLPNNQHVLQFHTNGKSN